MADSLGQVAAQIRGCPRCRLSRTRAHAVPGEGDPQAPLFLVGEAPGASEDRTGRPFQGAAGRHLDAVLDGLGVDRSAVFIASVVRCRPPGNRVPRADEISACAAYLDRQLALVRPRAVVAMGRAAVTRLHPDAAAPVKVGDLRGSPVPLAPGQVLVVTYHPAAAMRFPACRQPFADDLDAGCRLAGL